MNISKKIPSTAGWPFSIKDLALAFVNTRNKNRWELDLITQKMNKAVNNR